MVKRRVLFAHVVDLPNLANATYIARVNRAVDFVTEHLAEPIRLEDVARAAGFSPFHFHRIFRALMGETLAAFVKRVRLERSLYLLAHRPGHRLTDIALACGFSSSSDYSRSFRSEYGVPPRVFDLERFRQMRREALNATLPAGDGTERQTRSRGSSIPDGFAVRLREQPARRVAFVRVLRPYGSDRVLRAAERLQAWAQARGLADGQWLGYQWDDPEIVALEHCRYDVGVEVPASTQADGEVGVADFASCTIAEIDVAGSLELELRALDWLYRTWLPNSDFTPAHQPGFEAWIGRPFAHGMQHFTLRIQLPLVSAGDPL